MLFWGGDEIFSNDCHTEWLRVSLSEMPEYFKKGEKKKKAAIRLGKTLEVYDWIVFKNTSNGYPV